MKSERRHELAENDLADSVESLAERFRPYVATILTAAIGGLVAVIVGLFVSSRWEASRAESWDACLAALTTGNEDAFREVLIRYPGTPAAQWAELVLADRAVSEATSLLFQKLDPANDIARQRLEQAAAAYQGLLSEQATGMIAQRATFGLAKARECLGELAEARRGYETLAKEYADSPMAELAAARATALARADSQQFYDWFFEQRVAAAADDSAADTVDSGNDKPDAEKTDGKPGAKPTQAATKPGAESADKPKQNSADQPESSAEKVTSEPATTSAATEPGTTKPDAAATESKPVVAVEE